MLEEVSRLEDQLTRLFAPVLSQQGLELYDLDYNLRGKLLRVFIRNPQTDTATIDDCVAVDRLLTPYIEESSLVPEAITLEVSSPGLCRKLKTRKHLESVMGQWITLKIQKQSQVASGDYLLVEVKEADLVLQNQKGEVLTVTHQDIKKANLKLQH